MSDSEIDMNSRQESSYRTEWEGGGHRGCAVLGEKTRGRRLLAACGSCHQRWWVAHRPDQAGPARTAPLLRLHPDTRAAPLLRLHPDECAAPLLRRQASRSGRSSSGQLRLLEGGDNTAARLEQRRRRSYSRRWPNLLPMEGHGDDILGTSAAVGNGEHGPVDFGGGAWWRFARGGNRRLFVRGCGKVGAARWGRRTAVRQAAVGMADDGELGSGGDGGRRRAGWLRGGRR